MSNRNWSKKELENLGVKFSEPHPNCVQISIPGWTGNYRSEYRLVLQNPKGDAELILDRPAKGSFRNGSDHLTAFPARHFGFTKFLKAIHERESLRYFQADVYDRIVASCLVCAKSQLVKAEANT